MEQTVDRTCAHFQPRNHQEALPFDSTEAVLILKIFQSLLSLVFIREKTTRWVTRPYELQNVNYNANMCPKPKQVEKAENLIKKCRYTQFDSGRTIAFPILRARVEKNLCNNEAQKLMRVTGSARFYGPMLKTRRVTECRSVTSRETST